jgi:hypothetical protein
MLILVHSSHRTHAVRTPTGTGRRGSGQSQTLSSSSLYVQDSLRVPVGESWARRTLRRPGARIVTRQSRIRLTTRTSRHTGDGRRPHHAVRWVCPPVPLTGCLVGHAAMASGTARSWRHATSDHPPALVLATARRSATIRSIPSLGPHAFRRIPRSRAMRIPPRVAVVRPSTIGTGRSIVTAATGPPHPMARAGAQDERLNERPSRTRSVRTRSGHEWTWSTGALRALRPGPATQNRLPTSTLPQPASAHRVRHI